jgi:poly-beta-1,6-N-acetyl-D-glucosamine N-deacetylase
MRRLLCILLMVIAATEARAAPSGQRFVAIGFHDVVDRPADLGVDAVTTATLVQFFDWLKGAGWTVVSLDDLSDAASGRRRLPDKAILLTFDDGYKSLYTRVFPLLKAYHYPAVAALVGSWMEDSPDGTVLWGGERVPRTTFVSWAEAREIQASGLVEFASHSYDLHHGAQANPQGNQTPAAITWRYDPPSGTYEDDTQNAARIRADLLRSAATMEAQLGRRPRAIVWPYGRYTGPALEVAKQLGFLFGLPLDTEPADTSDLYAIRRFYPTANLRLGDLVRNLRFEAARPSTLRIACLRLDALAAAGDAAAQDQALGHIIEGLRALGANTVVIDAAAATSSAQAPLGDVYFPTPLLPLRQDLLGRATWQIRTRAGVDVFLRLPLAPAAAAVGAANTPRLFADMLRYARADGVAIEIPVAIDSGPVVADRPEDIRARRAALDPARLGGWGGLGLSAYRAAAGIAPRLRLMLAMDEPAGPPDWADIALLPPGEDARQTAAVASRLRAQGWLRPDVSGRVAFSLPAEPKRQIDALRLAQRQGASAFALCPQAPALPPPAALSAVFSAASYPHRP